MAGRGGILLQSKKMNMVTKKQVFRHCCMFRNKLKFVISVLLVLCIFVFLKFQSQLQSSPSKTTRRVSSSFFVGPPKIAFLFLTRRHLPLDFLWGSFFEEADVANYSIYVHSEPGFLFDESTTRSSAFFGRQLNNSIEVAWGESSMIEAERLLLDAALMDPANQRFILLSDSCVPLYNFSYIYHYVMESPRSFVDSFLDKRDDQFNPKMSPVISEDKWRKGSQWFTLIRSHAEVVADDELIFPVFRKYCKRRLPEDELKGKFNLILQKPHNCIPDEHYLQTLLSTMGLEKQLERRTVTYTLWNEAAEKTDVQGWHPVTFSYSAATSELIKKIKDVNHVYFGTEYRTEWCKTNSTSVPCFLFARKFSQGAAMRLLSEHWLQ